MRSLLRIVNRSRHAGFSSVAVSLFYKSPVQEGDNLRPGAGLIGKECSGGFTSGNLALQSPEDCV